jgi:enoyl-CoA hydratase
MSKLAREFVRYEKKYDGRCCVAVVTISRKEQRNAVDLKTAQELTDAVRMADADAEVAVGILHGDYGTFCAGADLKAFATPEARNKLTVDGDGPMGPTRMLTRKPWISAIAGHAVAGGLELALWTDLRVVERSAVLGVFCRRWGVPLIDGGTVRLPLLIGMSRALDLILTGRAIKSDEALLFGLANRVVDDGGALAAAESLAFELAALPQECMRNDRASVYASVGRDVDGALRREFEFGLESMRHAAAGVHRFVAGQGRHGAKL